jgi:hypothetical protein
MNWVKRCMISEGLLIFRLPFEERYKYNDFASFFENT